MMDRRPGICVRTGGAARGRSPHTVGERSRGRGCRIVNTLAGPSPPIKGHRSPCGRSRWLGRETFRDGAGPPDRVAWWWAGAAGRRVGRWPSRVQRGVAVRIARVAEPGSPWRSLPPNPGRCHGRAGSRTSLLATCCTRCWVGEPPFTGSNGGSCDHVEAVKPRYHRDELFRHAIGEVSAESRPSRRRSHGIPLPRAGD